MRGSHLLTKTLMGNPVLRGLLNGSSVEVSKETDEVSRSQSTSEYPVLSLLTSLQVIKKKNHHHYMVCSVIYIFSQDVINNHDCYHSAQAESWHFPK